MGSSARFHLLISYSIIYYKRILIFKITNSKGSIHAYVYCSIIYKSLDEWMKKKVRLCVCVCVHADWGGRLKAILNPEGEPQWDDLHTATSIIGNHAFIPLAKIWIPIEYEFNQFTVCPLFLPSGGAAGELSRLLQ